MPTATHELSSIRVIIADDSAIAVETIRRVLAVHEQIRVVATAGNADELLAAMDVHSPDLVTLDLLMPGRTGLALIRSLSTRTKLVVVSDHDEDSQLALESLAQGAHAFVSKRKLWTAQGERQLVQAVLLQPKPMRPKTIVAIAGSTGAMPAFEACAGDLEGLDAALLVLQHLPAGRMESFAAWLTSLGLRANVARPNSQLSVGHTYVAAGDRHLCVTRGDGLAYDDAPPVKGHKPSATVLFESLAGCRAGAIVVVLSGMGDDGAAAIPALMRRGARCIVQRRDTCPVPSMPDAAMLAAGGRARSVAPRQLGAAIRSLLAGESRD
jgi:two-component system chemotaxis response regulator CheB